MSMLSSVFSCRSVSRLVALGLAGSLGASVHAQGVPPASATAAPVAVAAAVASPAPAAPASGGKVVASGVVPDDATRQAVLQQLRATYGVDRVEDQLGVGQLVAPPSWGESLRKILALPALKQVRRGSLKVRGNVIEITGEVDNEALRQQVVSDISTQLNPTYTVRNALRVVAAPSQQAQVDATLANRTIEFLPASATLTPNGQRILDELVPVLSQLQGKRFEVVGHTDADGDRQINIVLSTNRANAVRQYLAAKGVPYQAILTSGAGPDRPVAGNDTPEGRARNRRIEFKILN